ncbi:MULTISPECIES: hypothetical protein [Lactococcus]|uniref:hypothetical protein n=2 Tax=Lactococcus TaxID=1357 RepID=UPI00230083E7|nr:MULTISPECIES: hypothetical protein [unclassified Lactococcus]
MIKMKKKIIVGTAFTLLLVVGTSAAYTFLSSNEEQAEIQSQKSEEKPEEAEKEVQQSEENLKDEQLIYTNSAHQISGEKQDIKVQDWKVIDDSSGEQVLKVTFTFNNKTDQTIDLRDFAQDRISLAQVLDNKNSQVIEMDTNDLKGKKVHKKEGTTGVIYGKVLKDAPKIAFVFGMNRKAGETYTGGLTLNI